MSGVKNFLKTRKRGFLWITFLFFVVSLAIHWTFSWFSYAEQQIEHNQPIELSGYFNQTMRDTMENWQSEFLQLMWQVAGLSFLLYVGSPQSKENEERLEKKLDAILQKLEPEKAQKIIEQLKKEYPEK
jgi:GH25 family lysozyme M1 (1,4-beta-N-acetylmuramidase)